MSADIPPSERERELRRLQAIAIALLLGALVILLLSAWMGGQGVWAWTLAFSEAAVVGALADWFAVVALFRHPLGLPFPHTAIIPANKARIGDQLATFVRDHFLEPKILLQKLALFDPAARLGQWLAEPAQVQSWVAAVRAWSLQALDWLDDARLQLALKELLSDALQRWNSAETAAQVLRALTKDGRHHAVLDAGLLKLAQVLDQDEVKAQVSAKLAQYARAEWPKMIGVISVFKSVDSMADELSSKLAQAIILDVVAVLQDAEHPLRKQYEVKVMDYIARLGEDQGIQAAFNDVKTQLLQRPELSDYSRVLVQEIKAWLRADLSREDSALAQHLARAMAALGEKLRDDASLRAAINEHVLAAAEKLVVDVREGVTEHIAKTVKAWDEAQLVKTLELSVGRDLQYIRFNGTLVGGVIGLGLHALLTYGVPLLRGV
ncbi:MAG: hypothetical protein B7Y40_00150 [Gammaproteobacteria bacterium 28-57-27]|nr:MAG: hypothetical protein B7Y40_00150 [Gammaproteobacteria bacterium 28-57-27]